MYRCPSTKLDGYAIYTNTVPSTAFRGHGLDQVMFAVESVMDELARRVDMDPLEFRAQNVVGHGLRMDVIRTALADPFPAAPEGWLTGTGFALSMTAATPPHGHFADARLTRLADGTYDLAVAGAEFGDGTTTVQQQIVARELFTTVEQITVRRSDIDATGYDTAGFGSTGIVVAGRATLLASRALAARLLACAAKQLGVAPEVCQLSEHAVLAGTRHISLAVLHAIAAIEGETLSADGHFGGTSRTVALDGRLFQVAVDPDSGELRILRSVSSADAGEVMNPTLGHGRISADPALANAVRDATGIRFTELPVTRDRIWLALHQKQTRRTTPARTVAHPTLTRFDLARLVDGHADDLRD
ncbi:xanthine dehydrogenase family protein molybdopterin-binding subunit [Nocardia sp. NPDC020380]|uniref:xanthine dehydrogenase family protein molybdopterin-binding subunit n=1 Tax=Nocardia sp. NPDC020380 TaxID=3364309 RepID=UPI0037ACA96A